MPPNELLRLHVLGASGRLDLSLTTLTQNASAAFARAVALLEMGEQPVDVVIRDAPAVTIPELGIGGVAPDPWTIFIALDPLHPGFDRAISDQLAQMITHELHHLARRRAGCRGTTLWDAIVHEGLADQFVVEVCETEPPPWSVAIAGTELLQLHDQVRAQLNNTSYDHAVWFYGKDPTIAPHWAGYALGWNVVDDYLHRHPDVRASALAGLPANAFLNPGFARS